MGLLKKKCQYLKAFELCFPFDQQVAVCHLKPVKSGGDALLVNVDVFGADMKCEMIIILLKVMWHENTHLRKYTFKAQRLKNSVSFT